MRISVVAASEQVVGGAETYVRWLLQALAHEGHELGFAYTYPAQDRGRAIPTPHGAKHWNLAELGKEGFYRELEAFSPDVVFMQGLDDIDLECELVERFTTILFAHAYWGSCLTGSRTHTLPAREICRKAFGPACIALNYARGCGMLSPRRVLQQYRVQERRRSHLSGLAALVVASRHMRNTYERQGLPSELIHVLPCPPSGIEPDQEPPQARAFSDELLFLGRLTEHKGASHAIQATALASSMLGRRLRLVIAGDGPTASDCRELALRSGIDLEMLGWVDGARRIELLRRADALVISSLWPEPFGMVGLESGCVGLPAVGYGVGGVSDWLVPGVSGEIAPPFDVGELAAALVRALSDERHHHELRLGAWRRANTMTSRAHLTKLVSVFEQALERRQAHPDVRRARRLPREAEANRC